MGPGRLGTNGPTRRRASGRAARRPGLQVRRPSAECSAGCRYVDADDLGEEALRAAGGPGPKSSTWTESRVLTVGMMADFAPRL